MAPRTRKVLAVIGAAIVALIVALPLAFWLLLDEQQLRAQASRYVKEQTGRELRMNGPIGLSFFPWLGAELKDVSLSEPIETGGAPFAHFDEVDLRVRLIPLVRGRIDVGGIRGSGGSIRLAGDELRDLAVETGAFGGSESTDLSLDFDLVPAGGGTLPVKLESRMVLNIAEQRLDLTDLSGNAGEISFRGALRGMRVLDAPTFDGQFETGRFNLRNLLPPLGISYRPIHADAMSVAALTTRLLSSPTRTELRDLVFSLDGSTLKGTAVATPIAGTSRSAWNAQFTVDTFDVDRYLPAATPPPTGEAAADPYASLRDLTARARFEIRQLRAFGLQLTDVTLSLAARDGTVHIAPIRSAMYGGRGELAARMDVRGKVPAYHADGRLSGVDVQPLLSDAQQITALSGTGDLSFRLDAAAADPSRLLETSRGELALAVRDGRLEGVDFLTLLTQARTMADQLRGRPVSAQSDPANRTKFSRLSASAIVQRGVARSDDLRLEAPDLQATGVGTIDLARETIDYVVRASSDQAGNVVVPITVAGPFSAPAYRVETGAMLKEAAKQELQKQIGRKLKGLFKKP